MIRGIPASSGIAIGRVLLLPDWDYELNEQTIDSEGLSIEFEKLARSINCSKDELQQIKHEIKGIIGSEEASIFDVHLAMLDDPMFLNEVETLIHSHSKAAEVAVKEAMEKFMGIFEMLEDETMKERAIDVQDVCNRLLKHLLGYTDMPMLPTAKPHVLVANDLSPSQMAQIDPQTVLGIVLTKGGKTSHTAIMARAMDIPLVLGLPEHWDRILKNGETIIVDGDQGVVMPQPTPLELSQYELKQTEHVNERLLLQLLAHQESKSRDGQVLGLAANISSVGQLQQALHAGAAGVGLFRTEFLFMDRDTPPDEEEQVGIYTAAADQLSGRPLIIRTLDAGGDKPIQYLRLRQEVNPFLGYRAIRISLDQQEMFSVQLRAILRAGACGKVKMMFPMITSLEEVRHIKKMLAQAKMDLRQAQVDFDEHMEIGITIEVPAAALMAHAIAAEVDFLSIGTNDLVQYILAVDRMNERISESYDHYHPAILHILKQIVDAAHTQNCWVGVCGEMAGDPLALPIWLALKIDELSMAATAILPVKKALLQSSAVEAEQCLSQLLTVSTGAEIRTILHEYERG